jgi:peptidoglycan/LPS O-acetylase OafA/YrhL
MAVGERNASLTRPWPAAAAATERPEPRLPYLPGLDGLRALAVIAVLLYHAGLHWMPAGFLGVEVFFVISGYLITALLLAEWRQRGRIDFKAFWLRRARRLLPALYLLLVLTLAFAVVFLPEEVAGLRDDAIAAFGYVTNWYLILGHKSYFETVGRPSVLQHLWSLAVEEQFYVLWPLLLAALMSMKVARLRRHFVPLAVLAGAATSALLMAILYRPDVDPSWLYYRTDTRASGLLVGAALAFVWVPGQVPAPHDETDHPGWLRRARWSLERFRRRWAWSSSTPPLLLDAVGLAALGGLAFLCVRLDESKAFLYQGGFALVGLATAAAIAIAVHPRARLGKNLLGRRPLRWVGLRSYGIYLWHWPVFMLTRPELDVPIGGLALLAVRLAATVGLAALSYRYVETPIRTGALGRAWEGLCEARGSRRRALGLRWGGAAATGAAFCVALGVAVAHAQPPAPPSYLPTEAVRIEASDATPEPETAEETAETELTATPAPTGRVTAIGDSVMIGAAAELQRALGDPDINAEVGRQAPAVVDVLRQRRAAGQLGDTVVVHIGSNGFLTSEQFDEMMQELAGVRRVVFVNVKVPRPWEGPNNEVLADGVRRYAKNAVLVDWHAASAGWPELFVEDGYHLQLEGQRLYADLIAAQVNAP